MGRLPNRPHHNTGTLQAVGGRVEGPQLDNLNGFEVTLRNGLRQNEIERKYAKAYESTYMTEQLAKLVVCISHQTQQLRTKKLGCVLQALGGLSG